MKKYNNSLRKKVLCKLFPSRPCKQFIYTITPYEQFLSPVQTDSILVMQTVLSTHENGLPLEHVNRSPSPSCKQFLSSLCEQFHCPP